MSKSLLLKGPTGFRFTRPTIGQIGATDNLHPYVKAAVDTLVTRLERGFEEPPAQAIKQQIEKFEIDAVKKEREADDAQRASARGARNIDEAYEEHGKAEDIAERLNAEYESALARKREHQGGEDAKKGAKGTSTPSQAAYPTDDDLKELKKRLDKARKEAESAAEAVESVKDSASKSEEAAARARRAATEARDKVLVERAKLHAAPEAVATVLSLPIYSRDGNVETLLSKRPPAGADVVGLEELIDRLGDTEELFEVRSLIESNRKRLPYNLRSLISRDKVVEYLFARAKYTQGFKEPEGIFNSIVDEDRGGKFLYHFATEYALEQMRTEKRLTIQPETMDELVKRLREDPVSLRRDPFEAILNELAAEFVYGDKELALVLHAEHELNYDIPSRFQPALVDYIRRTNADEEQINKANAAYFISIALTKLQKEDVSLRPAAYGAQVGVEDYSVSYYEDRITAPEYERASIEAAAQMYLTMVWGDMLGIFPVVDRIAMQTASEGQAPILLEVRSRELSNDLRMYVLDEEFRDLKTGRVSRRVSPNERQMFYRQLFGIGDAQVVVDEHVNPDFQRYWAVLMMEVVKYIGKVEENGDNYSSISASKVYQAMADLQYNLSAYCTGLPKIAAPTMYAEMDFVIQRILDSEDVKQQLGRRGSPSFWKVVEQVRGMQDFTPLRNKGMFGHKIISTIAQATSAFVEDQPAFEEFIANVEAFIVAEDQLAEAGGSMAGLQFPGFFGFDAAGAGGGFPGMPTGMPGMPTGFPGMPGGMFGTPSASGNSGGNRATNGTNQPSEDWNF